MRVSVGIAREDGVDRNAGIERFTWLGSAPDAYTHAGVAVKTHDPASKAMEKDYDITDIERLMGKRQWKSYDEMIKWLEKEGDADRRFTPGEVRHMIEDLSRMRASKKPMPQDPQMLFQEMKSRR
jgi:hypothetical protein